MAQTVRIVSPGGLAKQTEAFIAYNDKRYATKKEVGDVQAQVSEDISGLSARLDSEHPVGSEIVSKAALNPATLYGGKWETDSSHLFRGVYVYRRIS